MTKTSWIAVMACITASWAQPSPTLSYYSFLDTPNNCTGPSGTPVIDSQGILYGTAYAGASWTGCYGGCGAVYAILPPSSPGGSWTESMLYQFMGGLDGANPESGVVIGSAPGTPFVLYGSTQHDGAFGSGTIFQLTPPEAAGGAWTLTTLYSFTGTTDGADPEALLIGPGGTLYGSALTGGVSGCSEPFLPTACGTLFSLAPPQSPGGSWTSTCSSAFNPATPATTPPASSSDAMA
jgi:hypothetical protein